MTSPTPTESDATPIRPKLTAEEALTRLLELIRTSRTSSEFTRDRMSQVFGVEFVTYRPGYHAFGEQVTPDWWYSIDVEQPDESGSVLTLRFTPEESRNEAYVPLTDICQLDFDRFSSELEAMGFTKEPYYAEHGRLLHYSFGRTRNGISEMTVIASPTGERVWNEQTGSGRACIRTIRVF